jgi:AraC family transcriptional regulator
VRARSDDERISWIGGADEPAGDETMETRVKSEMSALALRVGLDVTAAGVVELGPVAEHRIKVHASGPVRGECEQAPFVYERGAVDILPAGNSDRWLQHEPATSVMLQLPPSLLSRTAEELGLDPARVALEPRNHLRDARIEHIAWALEAEHADEHASGLLYAESLGTALAVHLLGHYRQPRVTTQRGLSRGQLRRVAEYIEANLDRTLSLERLATVAGLGMTHFKVLFRRSTGLPVHAYVVRQRVARARSLLAAGHLPISQVALEAGFAHQSHMARCMRRVLGVTPSALARGRA